MRAKQAEKMEIELSRAEFLCENLHSPPKATFTSDARPTPAHSRPIFMAWSGMIG